LKAKPQVSEIEKSAKLEGAGIKSLSLWAFGFLDFWHVKD